MIFGTSLQVIEYYANADVLHVVYTVSLVIIVTVAIILALKGFIFPMGRDEKYGVKHVLSSLGVVGLIAVHSAIITMPSSLGLPITTGKEMQQEVFDNLSENYDLDAVRLNVDGIEKSSWVESVLGQNNTPAVIEAIPSGSETKVSYVLEFHDGEFTIEDYTSHVPVIDLEKN